MPTIADKIIKFNKSLEFSGKLPRGINLLNPFKDNPAILPLVKEFYKKFYDDNSERALILGINPGRHGAGVTGIPFSDTKRLAEFCGVNVEGFRSHEPSSVFVYDVINAYGGVKKFYSRFFITSICPLGFTSISPAGREVNYNYYDNKELFRSVYDFIVRSINAHLNFGFSREVCFCMGGGTNYKHLMLINEKEKLFKKIVPLEHPRYIMQYKLKKKDFYIDKYLTALKSE